MTINTGKETAVSKESNVQQAHGNEEKNRVQIKSMIPAADIHETNDGAILYIDLPGVNHDSLDISVDSDVLTIKGGITLDTPETLNPTYMDVQAGMFSRQFTLSAELDTSKIDANLKNGILTLIIPRSEQHKPRKIEVKAA